MNLRAGRFRAGVISMVLVPFVFCAILAMFFYGRTGRVYSATPEARTVAAPQDALKVWEERGIRGRILFLFDRNLNADRTVSAPSAENYVYLAIRNNMVRRIYHVIPDGSWEEVERTLDSYPLVSRHKGVYRTFFEDGSSLLIMRLRDVPAVKEKALVHINADYWDMDGLKEIAGLLKKGVLRGDVVTVSGAPPAEGLKEIIGAVQR